MMKERKLHKRRSTTFKKKSDKIEFKKYQQHFEAKYKQFVQSD